jgi:type I restriction enzyme M protein
LKQGEQWREAELTRSRITGRSSGRLADLLRGNYKPSEYGKVILPLTVLRRLDCVLEATKENVLATHEKMKGKADNLDPILMAQSGEQFYNVSKLTLPKLLDDAPNIADNLRGYIAGFSP